MGMGTIGEDQKVYTTSDNSRYIVKKDQDITSLIKHCSDNNLKLFDGETEVSIIKKAKKTK